MAATIEIAIDIAGRQLWIGEPGDFITPPDGGGQKKYFFNGQLYEVEGVIETIGDQVSLTGAGTMLYNLLTAIYGNEKAESLLAAGQRIGATTPALVRPMGKERLIYIKLRLQEGGGKTRTPTR